MRLGVGRFGPRTVAGVLGTCLLVAVVVVGLFFSGTTFRPSPTVSPTLAAAGTSTASPASPSPSPAPVTIRWFARSSDPSGMFGDTELGKFISNFNAAHHDIKLELEIAHPSMAYDRLMTEMEGGDGPDIIGPIGTRGRNGFGGQFLDLMPYVQRQNVNLDVFPNPLIQYFQEGQGNALIGLPYLLYPGFLWYNADLFDAAGLPYPPTKVGDRYQGKIWDWAALTDVAKRLTLDANGRHPGDAGFRLDQVRQWGIDFQWTDARRMASTWKAGSFVAEDGRTAEIPPAWRAAWRWYRDAMWTSGFAPTGKNVNSTYLNNGATMGSGHIAMGVTWAWAIPSVGNIDKKPAVSRWNIAVLPSYDGQTSSPLDADTFCIWKGTRHPDQAFTAMLAIMADKDLRRIYGGMPAETAEQQPFLDAWQAELSKIYPKNELLNRGVFAEMIDHPAIPSHEADMPNFLKVIDLYSKFYTRLQNEPEMDVDAELAKLRADIQAAFDEVK